MSIPIPDKLYKFEIINETTLRNLKNSQLYFARPSSFNDPFDCSLHAEMFKVDTHECCEIFNHYAELNGHPTLPKVPPTAGFPKEIIETIKKSMSEFVQEKKDNLLNGIGCTCFSESNKNILMWSHYANGHKGMCLEFDTTHHPFNKAMKVDYSESFAEISPSKIIIEQAPNGSDEWSSPLRTKHLGWKYEREWRIFHNEPDTICPYSAQALKSIYFGASINKTDLEIVCLIIQGQNPNVKFYKSIKSDSKYSVDFEKFTYTPLTKTK